MRATPKDCLPPRRKGCALRGEVAMTLLKSSRWRGLVAAALERLSMLLLTIAASALLSGVLVSMAPGIGTDERQLDLRLSEASLAAVRSQAAGSAEVARGSPGF